MGEPFGVVLVLFPLLDTIPNTYDLKEEHFGLVHDYGPWSACSKALAWAWAWLEKLLMSVPVLVAGKKTAKEEQRMGP